MPKNILGILAVLAIALAMFAGTGSSVRASPLLASGDLDPSFNGGGKLTTAFSAGQSAYAKSVVIQSDGRIVAAGYTGISGVNYDFSVARYTPGGMLDTTFNLDGKRTVSLGGFDRAFGVAIHKASGKIVVVGESCVSEASVCDAAIVRLNPGGGLDTTFSGDGKSVVDFGGDTNGLRALAVYPDGRILAAGFMFKGSPLIYDFAVIRYTAAGSLDASFSGDGKASVAFGVGKVDISEAIAIQPDGKIVVGGWTCDSTLSNCNFALARLNADGSLDTSFSTDGKQITNFGANSRAHGLALQADGRIVLVGERYTGVNGYFVLARYNTNGSLDTTFSGDGKQITDFSGNTNYDSGYALHLQADGKIVVCGAVNDGTADNFALARYTGSGDLDTSFSGDGKTIVNFGQDDSCEALDVQADGKYILAGNRYDYTTKLTRFALARVLP